MPSYFTVLAIALLPAGGSLLGSLIAERVPVRPRFVGAMLHAAAGVAIAVISIGLMPRVLQNLAPWLLVAAFCGGAGFSVLLARGVRRRTAHLESRHSRAWMMYIAVAVDLLSDGLMTGIGSSVSSRLGLVLGLSQVVANVPGGFAAAANFRSKGVTRRARLIAGASLALPALAGAAGGYWLLRDAAPEFRAAALAFVAGVLLLTIIEDIVPQADEPRTDRWITTISFTAGFGFFALLSLYAVA